MSTSTEPEVAPQANGSRTPHLACPRNRESEDTIATLRIACPRTSGLVGIRSNASSCRFSRPSGGAISDCTEDRRRDCGWRHCQRSRLDCMGTRCLNRLGRHHGRWLPLREARAPTPSSVELACTRITLGRDRDRPGGDDGRARTHLPTRARIRTDGPWSLVHVGRTERTPRTFTQPPNLGADLCALDGGGAAPPERAFLRAWGERTSAGSTNSITS